MLHAWQGLGYYSRARRLHHGAKVVVERHGGKLPSEQRALLALPGIGAYSAGAIASIAFGKREPLVDGNVVRVLTRHFGLRGDPGKLPLKRRLWELAGSLVVADRPGDFNQALMELGATVCTPAAAPRCDACPLASSCEAKRRGLVRCCPSCPRAQPRRWCGWRSLSCATAGACCSSSRARTRRVGLGSLRSHTSLSAQTKPRRRPPRAPCSSKRGATVRVAGRATRLVHHHHALSDHESKPSRRRSRPVAPLESPCGRARRKPSGCLRKSSRSLRCRRRIASLPGCCSRPNDD